MQTLHRFGNTLKGAQILPLETIEGHSWLVVIQDGKIALLPKTVKGLFMSLRRTLALFTFTPDLTYRVGSPRDLILKHTKERL